MNVNTPDENDAVVVVLKPTTTGTVDTTPVAPHPAHHRQPGEGVKPFAAFKSYCEAAPNRSLARVAQELGKSTSLLERWSANWRWQERLQSWQDEQDEQDRVADAQAALERARVRAERRAGLEDDEWELGGLMKAKARKMLAFPLATTTVETDTATGLQTTVVKPGPWRFRDVATLFVAANRMQRLAVGLATDKVEATGKDDAPLVPDGSMAPQVTIVFAGTDAETAPERAPTVTEADTGGV